MLENNNEAVIKRMAGRSLRSNRRRSITMILAVLLSTFLLFCILTVGITYLKMDQLQTIRMNGGEFDAVMYGATEEQLEILKNSEEVLKTGFCGVAGYVEETLKDQTPNVGLIWSDPVCWNEMEAAAREWIKGTYPVAEDELMVTESALKECGYEEAGIGDTLKMTYSTVNGSQTGEFRICGIWGGFGNQKTFHVSEAFYKKSGSSLSEVTSGRVYINFHKKLMTQAQMDDFTKSMKLGKQQTIYFAAYTGASVQLLAGALGLMFIICLCAYLLIYNIMYLSVAGNIRYYGLLQTIGMTGRQICRLMYGQMLLIGTIGITGGLLLGGAVSFFLIPSAVRSLGINTKQVRNIEITFHPAVFFLTILVIGLTMLAASRKPAKTAVACSPIEALGYRSKSGTKKSHKTGHGKLIWRLAGEQIKKDKKKAAVVMLSLAAGMSVFLCMITLFKSQGAREYTYNYMNLDMILKNDTINRTDQAEHREIIDEELLGDIKGLDGVSEIHPVTYAEITVPWEPEFSDQWMREFYERWMYIPYEEEIEEYQEHPENFGSCLIGIDQTDLDCLNQAMEHPIDPEAFLRGETCILVRNGLDFQENDLKGKNVTCAQYGIPDNQRTFQIAGLTDESYYVALRGYPPTIIVSDRAVKEFVPNPIVFKTGIRYLEEYDQKTESEILELLSQSSERKNFSYDSKIELMENVRKAQGNMVEIGIGIIIILAFIGLMNYMNTIVGSIQSRQVEISVMESVGMTGKQVQKMLITEGLLYAGGAWILTLTLGMAATCMIYQSMNYRGAAFSVPWIPVLSALLCIVLICVAVPVIVYHSLEKKGTVVERIKGME